MGNCFTCLQSPDTPSGSSANAGHHRQPDGSAVLDTVVGCTTTSGGATHVRTADSADTVPERSERDGLLSHSPQHFTSLTTDGGLKKPEAIVPFAGAGGHNFAETSGQSAKEPQVSDNTLNTLFEEYKDDQEDAILSEGIERLCTDLGYKPDDFAILVLAWRLDASQMCRFTKSEFIQGCRSMGADTIAGIRRRLEETVAALRAEGPATDGPAATVGSDQFKQLYRFTFVFGLEPGFRIVSLDMAIILWRLVFTVHTPAILDRWLYFLEQHPNIRGVPKDTWNMFLNFAESVDITAYDDTEAWPSLFDDFVEYETDRTNQNDTKALLMGADDRGVNAL